MSLLKTDSPQPGQVASPREQVREFRWVVSVLSVSVVLLAGLPFLLPTTPVNQELPSLQGRTQLKMRQEIERRFQEGVVMLHAKQFEHALTAFHRVMQLDPKMPEAYVNAGYALLGLGDATAAADFFESATVLRPTQLNAYYGLGEALSVIGNKRGALQAMEAYLHRSPPEDPYRRKAEAAVWELRAELSAAGTPGQNAAVPPGGAAENKPGRRP